MVWVVVGVAVVWGVVKAVVVAGTVHPGHGPLVVVVVVPRAMGQVVVMWSELS